MNTFLSTFQRALVTLILLVMTNSSHAGGGPVESDLETWWVNSAKRDCVGVAPMTCFEVQKNDTIDPQAWELFYSPIQGFQYQPGNLYQILVRIEDRPPPLPADVSSKVYSLVEILSQTPDPALRITNLWKVDSVGAIDEPKNVRGQPLVFEFNATQRSYSGDLGCNQISGSLENNDGEHLKLGSGIVSLKHCPNMEVEQAVGQALQATRRYELRDRKLRFYDEQGKELISFLPGD